MRPFFNVFFLCTFVAMMGHRLPRFRRAPGTVGDLAVVVPVSDSTVTLRWTEVPSGVAAPARYDVRWGPSAAWSWTAAYTAKRTLQVVGASAAGGLPLQVTVLGLTPATAYTFQLVAYSGTLNVNAVFGALSNLATATTLAPALPPVPPQAVASVRIDGFLTSGLTLALGASHQAVASTFDASGAPLAGRTVTWRAAAPAIASVDATGVVRALAPGIGLDTIYATAPGGAQAWMLVSVPPSPNPACSVSPPPLGCGMRASAWASLGVPARAGTYGPWFILDSLGQRRYTVRVVVSDTLP